MCRGHTTLGIARANPGKLRLFMVSSARQLARRILAACLMLPLNVPDDLGRLLIVAGFCWTLLNGRLFGEEMRWEGAASWTPAGNPGGWTFSSSGEWMTGYPIAGSCQGLIALWKRAEERERIR